MSPDQPLSETTMETERANWGGDSAHRPLSQKPGSVPPLCNEVQMYHLRDAEYPRLGAGGRGEAAFFLQFSGENLEAKKGDHDPGSDSAAAGPICKNRSLWTLGQLQSHTEVRQ